ncbi:MAG UNVERIFIED_CONTAM: hypothetical protein LVQ98_03935 [Rickettsiaceae bacterium]|jgi:flagellar hook protein FlgE
MSTTATNALSQMREGTDVLGANVAKAPAYGASEDRVLFLPGQGRKASIAAPVLSVQSTMHIKHTFSATGFDGDLFVDSVDGSSNGVGMLLVKTREGATVLTTNTSFTLNKNNELVNSNGAKLLGYIPNADGSLPANSADISKLQSMDLTRATSRAEATTKIGLRLNLKATQKAMQGPGSTVILSAFGAAKASTNKAIITPGENTNALLLEGDVLTLKSTAKGTAPVAIVPTYSFHFKGFATSREVTDTNNLYSATSPSKPFNVNPQGVAGDNTHLAFGQGIKINVGGADGSNFEFKATQASNESHLGNFNSLQSLADAINRTSGGLIRATIGSDNRLRIAPKNANHAMSFEDLNAPGGAVKGLVQQLGLQNQAAKADNVFIEYYASLEELSLKINSKEGLSSEVLNNGQIRFGADVATSSLNANGETSNARIFQRAYSGGIAGIDNTMDANLRNLVTIESPNHGLKSWRLCKIRRWPSYIDSWYV